VGAAAVIFFALMLYFALRPRPARLVERPVTVTPTASPLPQVLPSPFATAAPTITKTPTSIFAPRTPDPPVTGSPEGREKSEEPAVCQKGGVAWHDPNRDDELYGPATLGEAGERCWLVGQIWTHNGEMADVWVFALLPGTTVTFAGHRGGIAWFFSGSQEAVFADLEKQLKELQAKDPRARISRLILPEGGTQCRLVVKVTPP
jgi:hypothetical protein